MLFDPADRVLVERGAADLDARRRTKPIKKALPRPPVAAAGMDERRSFVPAFIAAEPQSWQSYLRLSDLPVFLPVVAAGFFLIPAARDAALTDADLVFVLGLADRAAAMGAL